MATFALRLLKHDPLLCSTDGTLHNDASTRNNLPGLDSNLFSQLSCG
jgi:hypothetical protein